MQASLKSIGRFGMKQYIPQLRALVDIADLPDPYTALDTGYVARDPHHVWLWGAKTKERWLKCIHSSIMQLQA